MTQFKTLPAPPTFILIAEDDIDDQEMINDMIKEINPECQMEFIGTGSKVMSYLEGLEDENLPDLILLDFNLPEFTGMQILEQMGTKQRYSPIPKLLWSTSRYSLLKTECIRFGAEDFLVKPSSLQELDKTVRYILSFAKTPEQE